MFSKKMLKKLCLVSTFIFAFSSIFIGCGKTTVPTVTSNKDYLTKIKAPATITMYSVKGPDNDAAMPKLAADFQNKFSNIKVNNIEVPFDSFDSKLLTMIASGTAPDITTHFGWAGYGEYYSKNQLLNLTPFMQASGFDAVKYGIPDSSMKIFQKNGQQYAIPLQTYVSLMLYNKDIFDKQHIPYPPSSYEDKNWTYDKMIDDAKLLSNHSTDMKNVVYGLMWGWSAGDQEQDPQYFGHSPYPDDTFTKKNGFPGKNTMGSTEVVADMQRVADLSLTDKVSPPPSFINSLAGNDPFLAGNIAMEVSGAWILQGIKSATFRVGVAAIPSYPTGKVRDMLYNNGYWIFKSSKNPEAAFEYIKFLASKEEQQNWVDYSAGDPPASTFALDKYSAFATGIDSKDLANVFNGGIKYGAEAWAHLMPGSNEIHTLITNELTPLTNGNKKASELCPPLQTKLDDLLQQINDRYKK